jgi:hypothetical protein
MANHSRFAAIATLDRRIACVALTCVASLALVGCAGSNTPTTSSSAAASGYDSSEQTWFAAPVKASDFADVAASSGPDVPSEAPSDGGGIQVSILAAAADDGTSAAGSAGLDDAEPADIDPCSLLSASNWADLAGTKTGRSFVVDPGEQCLYTAPGDLVRLTVEIFALTDGEGLASERLATAAALPQSGSSVQVLNRYPAPYATTVFARPDGREVVVTVFSRDSRRSASESARLGGRAIELVMNGLR